MTARKATQKSTHKRTPQSIDPPPSADAPAENAAQARFLVVGIGASAGGLAAFEAFFSGMSPDAHPDMAFVLVQHLAPDHKSMLTELVGRYTRHAPLDTTVDGAGFVLRKVVAGLGA